MKKIIAPALLLTVLLLMTACAGKNSDGQASGGDGVGKAAENEDYFEWDMAHPTEIVDYTEKGLKQTELVIPAKCTKVYDLSNNTTVKHIKFANPDTEIVGMFADCTNLESIELPENLSELPNKMFSGCKNLRSIDLPANLTSTGNGTFFNCFSLKEVSFGNSLVTVGSNAFYSCKSLERVSLPDTVQTIEGWAFQYCEKLEEVKFGSGLKTVGMCAFQMCDSLKKVELPEGVTTLEEDAFGQCAALEEIYLPASLESMKKSSIVQAHTVKVFVTAGSYADQTLGTLIGADGYDKQYK